MELLKSPSLWSLRPTRPSFQFLLYHLLHWSIKQYFFSPPRTVRNIYIREQVSGKSWRWCCLFCVVMHCCLWTWGPLMPATTASRTTAGLWSSTASIRFSSPVPFTIPEALLRLHAFWSSIFFISFFR